MALEQVGNPGAGTTQQPGGVATGTVQPGGDGKGGKDRSFDGRMAELKGLVAEKNRFQDTITALSSENSVLKERLARLEERFQSIPQPKDDGLPKSLEDLSEGQLFEAFRGGITNGENPQFSYQALEERMRRMTKDAVNEALQRGQEHLQSQQTLAEVTNRILHAYPDAKDPESALTKAAMPYLNELQQKYGKDVFQKTPHMLEAAYGNAHRDLSLRDRDRLLQLEQENQRLKELTSLEPGARAGTRPNDAVRESLEKGDVRSAIRSLGIVKR